MTSAYPFEASVEELESRQDFFIDAVFSNLQSSFLVLPRGSGFVEYPRFEEAYQVLRKATAGFDEFSPKNVLEAFREDVFTFVVIRTILGLQPPEWAYLTTNETGVSVTQNFIRNLDRKVREDFRTLATPTELTLRRINALVETACNLLNNPLPSVSSDMIHRLDKVDTRSGIRSVRHLEQTGVSYAMLLYERFLGRPFASHRDAVSELVGEIMETAVEQQLIKARLPYRKIGRAEAIEGFDQAPDFIVPDEWNPAAVIEAKITEDDGTARDKVTRIQHLAAISARYVREKGKGFEVIACIDGRGFGVRREDMRKLLICTKGKIFTLSTLDHLVEHTSLSRFALI